MTPLVQIAEIVTAAVNKYSAIPYEDRQLSTLRKDISKVIEILNACEDADYKDLFMQSEGSPYQNLVMLLGSLKYMHRMDIDAEIYVAFQHERSENEPPIVNFRIRFND